MKLKMKGAFLYGPGDVRLKEVEIPSINREEVLIKIEVALTCGTDAKVYQRGGHLKMIKVPSLFGHEFAGVIKEVGDRVRYFKEGMRVVAANSAPCNQCFYCKTGQQNLCKNLLFINGAYAEYIKIPEPIVKQNLLEIPQDVSFKEAALVEPVACALQGINKCNIKLGDTIAINGAGPLGLIFIQLAKLKGAKVIALDKQKERLSIAKKCGADEGIDVSAVEDEIDRVRELTEETRGVDVAIEAVGNSAVWEKAIAMVRKGGEVLLFGGCPPGESVKFDTELIHYAELTLKGSFHHTPYYIKKALDLIVQRKIKADFLITQELPLNKISEALEMMVNHQGIKTAVIP